MKFNFCSWFILQQFKKVWINMWQHLLVQLKFGAYERKSDSILKSLSEPTEIHFQRCIFSLLAVERNVNEKKIVKIQSHVVIITEALIAHRCSSQCAEVHFWDRTGGCGLGMGNEKAQIMEYKKHWRENSWDSEKCEVVYFLLFVVV